MPSAQAIPAIRCLRLVGMRAMDAFPASLAAALRKLEHLDLAGNEGFTRFPVALTRIHTLCSLDLSYNEQIQLQFRDAHLLADFANLQCLRFVQESPVSHVTGDIFKALAVMRPDIVLVLTASVE